jgi:hypothetical protein
VTVDPVQKLNLALTAGGVAASLVLASPGFALSLGIGGVVEGVNFRGLKQAGRALVSGEIAPSRFGVPGFGLRFLFLAGAIFAALHAGANPVGLLIGLSLIMPAVVVDAWRNRPAIDPDAPVLDPDHEDWDTWNPWVASERAPEEED